MAAVAGGTNVQGAWVAFSSAYGSTPQLAVSMRTSVPGNVYVNATHTGLNGSGFYPVVYRTNATECLVDWMAVGLRPLRAADQREMLARFHDHDGHVLLVQTPELGREGMKVVEAHHWDVPEDTGMLVCYDSLGRVTERFDRGEWTSYQREYIMDGYATL